MLDIYLTSHPPVTFKEHNDKMEPEVTCTESGLFSLLLVNPLKILLLTYWCNVIDFSVSFCHFSCVHTLSFHPLGERLHYRSHCIQPIKKTDEISSTFSVNICCENTQHCKSQLKRAQADFNVPAWELLLFIVSYLDNLMQRSIYSAHNKWYFSSNLSSSITSS